MASKIAEVIETSTAAFSAQCHELYGSPPFGALVRAAEGDTVIYAVVSNVTTASIEPGRRPVARGRDEADEQDVYTSSPQLSRLLRTEFEALVVGHRCGDELYHYLPPRPARIHGFVYPCDGEEVAAFTTSLDYLGILLAARENADELVAASLRHASAAHDSPREFLVAAGKELASLLGGEPNRLNGILRRIKA